MKITEKNKELRKFTLEVDENELGCLTEGTSEAYNEFLREVHKLGWNVPNPVSGKSYDW